MYDSSNFRHNITSIMKHKYVPKCIKSYENRQVLKQIAHLQYTIETYRWIIIAAAY